MGGTSIRDQITELSAKLDDFIDALPSDDLHELTVEAILEHRKLLDIAEKAYNALEAARRPSNDCTPGLRKLEAAYLSAMKRNQAQLMLVASLTDRLGYIPDVNVATPTAGA